MEEKAFPRGGAEPSTDTARKLGAPNKTHHEPKRVHKIFSDCENHPEDAIDPSNTVNHYERESNLFTKLKKQKLAEVKRKAAIKQHKKSKPKPEQLVREEERIVEHLTYTTLTPGMLLLGRIKEFHGSDILVTLPGGLRGFVSPFNVSDAFTARLRKMEEGVKTDEEEVQNLLGLFSLGRMLICKVTNITKNPSHGKANHNREKVTVHLTINPREIVGEMGSHIFNGLVVPAAVSGVEDHGYVMDVGLESLGIRAFLAKDKSVVQGEIGLPVIEEGQVLICAVESGGLTNKNPTARALQLNRNLTAVELSPKKISPANILPGAVLNVAVISKGPFGLRVQCGSVQGFVSRFHLINSEDSVDNYKEKEVIAARVFYVNSVTKQTAFTLKSSLYNAQTWNQVSRGELYEGLVVQDASIIHVVESVGLYLTLKNGHTAFAPRKNLGIPPSDPLRSHFKVGAVHPCVVTGFNDLDEIVLVNLKSSLINQPYLSYHHLHVGQVLDCKIVALVPSGLVVLIGEGIQGFVPSSHLSEVPLKNWEKKFKDGMMMSCRIMELDPARKSLVLTHKKSLIDAKDAVLRSYENVEAGRIYTGVISKIKEQGMLVRFFQGVHGWVPASEFVQGISLENLYYEGQTVRCKVLRFDKKTQNLQLTLRLIKADVDDKSQGSSTVGSIVECRITKSSPKGVEVRTIPAGANGFIHFVHLADKASDAADVAKTLLPNQVVSQAVILKMTPLTLSMKPSYIEAAMLGDIPTTLGEVPVGRETVATVKVEKNYGVFVEIANGVGGLLPKRLTNLSHGDELKVGDSVLVAAEEVDLEKQRLLFRLLNRVGHIKVEPNEEKISDHKPPSFATEPVPIVDKGKHKFGDVVSAKIIAVEKARLKLRTAAKMVGYVRRTELCDSASSKKALLESYHVGQILSARVIGHKNILLGKPKGRRVLTKKIVPKPPVYDFSIRTSVLTAKDEDALRDLVRNAARMHMTTNRPIKIEADAEFHGAVTNSSLTPSHSFEERRSAKPSAIPVPAPHSLACLSLPDFSWDDEENNQTPNTSDDADKSNGMENGYIRKRRKLEHGDERAVYNRERETLDGGLVPETAEDLEKLVLTSSDDSVLWIRFMAFHLQNSRIEEARATGQKALQTISFRQETDRFNIWIALLNLENLHGTTGSLEDTFQNALQHSDPLQVYRQMAAIFANTGKHEQAESTYKKMTHRYKTAKEVWMDYGSYLMANKKQEAAHQTMQRSLQVLDQKNHIDVIVKFALLELEYGSKERAKTMFENLVVNYPKRTDLLHTYLSQMIKVKESAPSIRNLFERIIHMKLSARKMKVFFKRYLEYEEQHGSPATIEHVKSQAKLFVEDNSG